MTKISNQYSLTNILTADLANSRLGINNVSPTVALDVTGAGKFSGNVTSDDLILTAGTLFGAGNTGFSNRLSDTTLYLQMPATGFNITDNALNTRFILSSAGAATFSSSVTAGDIFSTDGTRTNFFGVGTGANVGYVGTTTNHALAFLTNNTERMRITSGGNVLIGGTSTLGASGTNLEISGGRAQLVVNSTTATASWFSVYPAGDGNTYILRNTGYSFLFGTATSQTTAGFVQQMTISSNGSIGAPSGTNIYNASDARLKKNISTTTYGLDTISALNPVKFNWIDGFEPSEDGKYMLGFVAQEVQEIIPEAIESFGGNSITIGNTIIDNPLRVNEKFIIPVLVKAIQELSAENTSLINRIEALENK